MKSVRAAWAKWLADLASTRVQIVVIVLGLYAWGWVDLLVRPHGPEHVVDLLKAATPVALGGLLAWAGVKVWTTR